MKAKDSVKNYDSKIREYTNYSYRQSKNACKNFGPREAGSESEKKIAEHFANELAICSNEVKTEEFTFRKTSSVSDNLFNLIFLFAAIVLTALDSLSVSGDSSVLLIIAAVFVMLGTVNIFSGTINKALSALISPKTTSSNIYAVRNADKEAKKRLVLVSNMDSMPLKKFKTSVFTIISAVGFVLPLAVLFSNATNGIFTASNTLKYIPLVLLIFIPFAVIPLFANKKAYSEGANKNLSGAFSSIAVLKYLKDNSIEMENTEICVLICGANEYLLAGADAFYKKHSADFADIETVFVNLDSTAGYEKDLGIAYSLGGDSQEFIKDGALDAGIELNDSPIKGKYLPAIAKFKGFDACTLSSLGADYEKIPDTHEDMKVKTIESALKTVVSGLFIYDEK